MMLMSSIISEASKISTISRIPMIFDGLEDFKDVDAFR